MKLSAEPEGVLEAVGLAAGLVPTPVIDTLMAAGLARMVMVACRVGVFGALADGPLDSEAIAARLGTHPVGTRKLLVALASTGYVHVEDGERFSLSPVARRWLGPGASAPLDDHMELMFLAWRWMEHWEDYVRTGETHDVHSQLGATDWDAYQRGMRALSALSARELAWRTPIPRGARHMVDVGGSHGYYSVVLCRRHPELRSVVVDLPEAVEHARPILEREGMGDRVVHHAADAREHDFGEETIDVALVSNLAHHLSDGENRELVRKLARALRPGGLLVVQELMRPTSLRSTSASGALADLYFAAMSRAGTWSPEEIAAWQRDAGLEPLAPMMFLTAPGLGQQSARRR